MPKVYNLCSECIFLRAYLGVNMFPRKSHGNKIFIIVGAYHKKPGPMCCSSCEPTCDFTMFKIVLSFYIESDFEKENNGRSETCPVAILALVLPIFTGKAVQRFQRKLYSDGIYSDAIYAP